MSQQKDYLLEEMEPSGLYLSVKVYPVWLLLVGNVGRFEGLLMQFPCVVNVPDSLLGDHKSLSVPRVFPFGQLPGFSLKTISDCKAESYCEEI